MTNLGFKRIITIIMLTGGIVLGICGVSGWFWLILLTLLML